MIVEPVMRRSRPLTPEGGAAVLVVNRFFDVSGIGDLAAGPLWDF